MSLIIPHVYPKIDFTNLKGLTGISDRQLEVHFGLHAGYIANTNKVNQQIAELIKNGKAGTLEYAELNRRLGFEYNGMRLHEYYFGNLAPGGNGSAGPKLKVALDKSFGSVDEWKKDFSVCGTMRGIGWVILYQDPKTGTLSNHWISDHEIGHPAGFSPIIVMDMWEHAFMIDYKPAEKAKYIEAILANLDWSEIETRMS